MNFILKIYFIYLYYINRWNESSFLDIKFIFNLIFLLLNFFDEKLYIVDSF
jgi:hypothetical protein